MHCRASISFALLAVTAAAGITASGVVASGLFATGVDANGAVLPGGSVDPHYSIVEERSQSVVIYDAQTYAWIQNSSTSKWIWQMADAQPTNVSRTFRTTVDLTGATSVQTIIKGRWSTDNAGIDILVNGVSSGNTCNIFTEWCEFTLTAGNGLIAGTNTIDFVVADYGAIAGFRAEPIATCGAPIGFALGDLNLDGVVGGADLGILLGGWGTCNGTCDHCPGDLNCDCIIDGADLGVLLGNWG